MADSRLMVVKFAALERGDDTVKHAIQFLFQVLNI